MSPALYRKRVFCADLSVGDTVEEIFCVERVERRTARGGGPYLRVSLVDRSGSMTAMVFDDVEALFGALVEGEYARVRGAIEDYRGDLRLKMTGAERWTEEVDPADFMLRGPVPGDVSLAGIRELASSIADPWISRVLRSFLDDGEFTSAFTAAPAAKVNHHAYVGGLAEHTLSVMRLCADAAEHYGELDRDLLVAGAFLHDIGKTAEIAVEPGFPYTEEGTLLGHIPLGYAMLRERIARMADFPQDVATDLGHLVLSHQGELEWGSPVQPRTVEALVLHFIDNLDSKVATARTNLAGIEAGHGPFVRSLGRSLFRRAAREAAVEPPARVGGGPDRDEPTLFDRLE
ncbi:MAG TPA: HD domain-containing protein [Gemmatimonadota bacterium]|nr:HD domain-containing protein [Gemmatimonadota bacterium]